MSEIEHKLLACLTNTDEIAKVWDDGLRAEVFEDPMCRRAYELIIDYWRDNQVAPTAYVIEHELPGFRFVADTDEAPGWLTEKLQQRYVTNQLQAMLRDAAKATHDDPEGTLKALYASAYDAMEAIAPRLTRSTMIDNIDERRRRYQRRQARPEGIGLPLGIPELDAHTGGLMPGELAAVGGAGKTGKSFYICNAAVNLRKAGYLPIVFTLEMSIAEMEERIDAMFSQVSYNRLTHATLNIDEARAYHAGQEALAEAGGILVENPEPGQRTVAHLINRARQAGADFVLIDQLSHMEAAKHTRDLKEHHADVMKGLSTEISRPGKEIPCLIAVQLRRPDGGNTAAIELHHFANAAEVEREVDLALGLSRTAEERLNNAMRLSILGARRCDTKAWLLSWQLTERTRIEALEEIAS